MGRGGLLWTLFFPLLAVIVVSLVIANGLAGRSVRLFLQDHTRHEMQGVAETSGPRFAPLVASGDLAAISDLCDEVATSTRSRLTVVLPGGRVVGDSAEDPATMDNHADRPEVRDALAGHIGRSQRYSDTTEAERIYVAAPVVTPDGAVFAVRASRSLATIDMLLRDVLRRIGLAGLGLALLAGIVTFGMARSLRNTLVRLRDQADGVADGDLGVRVHATGPHEIVGLGEALNRMSDRLRMHIGAIEEQRRELEAVMDSMVEGLLALDLDENVIRLNDAAVRLLGLDPERALGRSIQEVGRHPVITRLAQDTLAGGATAQADIRGGATDDTCLEITATELMNGDGQRIGALLMLNDVSRLRQLETMRKDFVANVSHELKTPITSIKGFVETLLEAPPDNVQEAERFLGIINRQADRLDAIIGDLLVLSRLEQHTESGGIDLQELPLNPLLERVVRDFASRDPQGASRITLACAATVRASFNAPLLEQAVGNLIGNALKYSPDPSPVSLSCEVGATGVRITVVDRGPGIAAEHLPRLFERFYRVDKARSRQMGGTGLGLAIVKHIAQAHRGRIEVTSKVGHGSTFILSLPLEVPA